MGKKAVIENGKVVNVIVYADEVGIRGLRLPIGQTLYDCTNVPTEIGDDFADGAFSRDGAPVAPQLSDAQRIAQLEAIIDTMLTGGDANDASGEA